MEKIEVTTRVVTGVALNLTVEEADTLYSAIVAYNTEGDFEFHTEETVRGIYEAMRDCQEFHDERNKDDADMSSE